MGHKDDRKHPDDQRRLDTHQAYLDYCTLHLPSVEIDLINKLNMLDIISYTIGCENISCFTLTGINGHDIGLVVLHFAFLIFRVAE